MYIFQVLHVERRNARSIEASMCKILPSENFIVQGQPSKILKFQGHLPRPSFWNHMWSSTTGRVCVVLLYSSLTKIWFFCDCPSQHIRSSSSKIEIPVAFIWNMYCSHFVAMQPTSLISSALSQDYKFSERPQKVTIWERKKIPLPRRCCSRGADREWLPCNHPIASNPISIREPFHTSQQRPPNNQCMFFIMLHKM